VRGSPWYFAKWPAQTVNYVESHDDMTFIDALTENPRADGSAPTPVDTARARLSAAILFMSVGIPMVSAGEDFMRSKRGVNNTYLRGDLNALDYERLYRYLGTHAYFSDWISFRLGPKGRVLRHFSRASEGFFRFFRTGEGAPFAVLLNADRSEAGERLLFAVNPTLWDVPLSIDAEVAWSGEWRQLADHERFIPPGSRAATRPVEPVIRIPALGCLLWSSP
jgi:pullulanase/glycogen debranching enzyme